MYSVGHFLFAYRTRISWVHALALGVVAHLLTPHASRADERGPHRIRIELDGAYSLRANDERDGLGFGGAFEYEGIVARVLGIGVRYEGVAFPYDSEIYSGSGFGVYHGIGPELRLHMAPSARRVDPWVAGGPRLALTGDLVRFGLQAAIGVDFLVGRTISLGPTLSYIQVIQPDDSQAGGADGRVLTFGLGLAWGPARDAADGEDEEGTDDDEDADADEDDEAGDTTAGTANDATGAREDGVPPLDGERDENGDDGDDGETTRTDRAPRPRVDTDGDGVMDDEDPCPNEPAPGGCPPPRPIELRVSDFDFDSAFLNQAQIDQLRLVLDRLRADRRIRRVQVIGHADQIGEEAHNVRLSERRAASVVDWLVSHGIARRRLQIVGRGSSEPILRDGSPEQLGTNRRVEFLIVDPPSLSD